MTCKKSYILLILASLILCLTSCSDDVEMATVDLRFTLTYNGDPLHGFEEVDYGPDKTKAFFTKYSMFLSNMEFVSTDDNSSVQLSEPLFIDLLTDITDEEAAKKGVATTRVTDFPAGTYQSVKLNIGLPSDVNSTKPADYQEPSPLSNTGEYWEGWSSYIFHKIEGKVDEDGDGTPEKSVALHIGSDDAFRQTEISTNIKIDEAQETIHINFDLADILEIDGSYYDFIATPQVHHLGALPKVLPILDSTAKKITIKVD